MHGPKNIKLLGELFVSVLCTCDRRNEKFIQTLGRGPLAKLTHECGKDIVPFSGFLMFMDFLVGLVVEHDIAINLSIIQYTLCVYHMWFAVLKSINMKRSKKLVMKIK